MKTVGRAAENGAGKQAGCSLAKSGCGNCCTKNYFNGGCTDYVECMANCESKWSMCALLQFVYVFNLVVGVDIRR